METAWGGGVGTEGLIMAWLDSGHTHIRDTRRFSLTEQSALWMVGYELICLVVG